MPSGFRVGTDSWLKEHEEAKELAQEVLQLVQERNIKHPHGGPEASRKTATARRKIGTLGVLIEKLLKALDGPETADLSEQEKNRRRDLLYNLRTQREQMQLSIRRNQGQSDREMLLGEGTSARLAPRETNETAELDSQGLLQMQTQTMKNQDQMLERIEQSVANTKHIAIAIGEEADLHTRLLDELEEDVEVTQSRMKAATVKVKQILRDSSHWKGGLCIFLLIITLVTVSILFFKLHRLFGL